MNSWTAWRGSRHEHDSKGFPPRRRWLAAFAALGAGALCTSPAWAAVTRAPAPAPEPTILIVGDSLSAEYGLARGTGWVALLERRLAARGGKARVVNASISGETTAGGAARLPALLDELRPTHVVIELGANDALRGLSLKKTSQTLSSMVAQSKARGAQVLLVGMMVPPNYGQRYALDFAAIFPAVAKAHGVGLAPFLLKGVADRPDAREWFQNDGIHPLAKAHPVMLDNVWQALEPQLRGR